MVLEERLRLTRKQKLLLLKLRDDPEADLVYEKNAGWWCGMERLSGQLARALIQLAFVSNRRLPGSSYDSYEINDCGRRHLENLPPYRDAEGEYHWTYRALLEAKTAREKRRKRKR